MAEPVTAIVGLVSAAVSLADRIHSFTSKVRNAPDVARDLSYEITITKEALDMLGAHLRENNAVTDSYDRATVLYCAVDGCNRQLQRIEAKISGLLPAGGGSSRGGLPSLINRAKWALDKDDVMEMMQALRGYVHVFHFAVNLDGMNAIKSSQTSALTQIQERLNELSISSESDQMVLTELREAKEAIVQLKMSTTNVFQRVHDRLDEAEEDTRLEELIASLQSLPYQEKHRDVQQRRQDGLGRWLLEEAAFREWEAGSTDCNVLWCPGAPGVGKTYLASGIIDYLEEHHDGRVLYFYFDYREQTEQTPFKVLITLLRQALSTYDKIPGAAVDLHKRTKKGLGLPSWTELMAIFNSTCVSGGEIFIVLDALDESDEHMHRDDILDFVVQLLGTSIRVLLTSRPYPWDIHETFANYPQIPMKASPEDIHKFLTKKIDTSRRSSRRIIDEELKGKIIDSITAMSNGMFLLPALQILNILGQTNKRQILESLDKLPSGLIENLDLTLERIRTQDAQDHTRADLAMATLMWISTAKRPLTRQELQHAVAIVPGGHKLDDLADPVMFTESCCGLVTIDTETNIVRFVHFSVSEYLEARRDALFPQADARLAVACLNYLMLFCHSSVDGQLHNPSLEDFDALTKTHHLLDYAATYWGAHATICYSDEVSELTAKFMGKPLLVTSWNQRFEFPVQDRVPRWSSYKVVLPKQVHGISRLHVAARLGLEDLARVELADPTINPNCSDSVGRTPLMFAAEGGSVAVLKQLLAHSDIQVNATDELGKTALWYAVNDRKPRCVSALMAADVDPNLGLPLLSAAQDYLDWDLQAAQKPSGIAEMLLASPRIDVNIKGDNRAAWRLIAQRCDIDTMKMLLARPDFEPAGEDLDGEVSLLWSYLINTDYQTEGAIVGAVRMLALLDRDPRFAFGDFDVLRALWNPLNYAFTDVEPRLRNGESDVFDTNGFAIFDSSGGTMRGGVRRALEAAGLSMAFRDNRGRGLLHFLANHASSWDDNETREFGEVVAMLQGHGLDINDRDEFGRTPLAYAGHVEIIQGLLDAGSVVEARDARDMLHAAVNGGQADAVKLILFKYYSPPPGKEGVSRDENATGPPFDIDAVHDDDMCTALHVAVFEENTAIARMLLMHGADPDKVSVTGPAIHYAMMRMNFELTALLVDRGADLNLLDSHGKSAWDRIARDHSEQLMDRLGLPLWDYKPTGLREARRAVLENILLRLPEAISTTDEGNRIDRLFRLGQQLLHLGDEAGATFAFDGLIEKGDEFRYRCCGKDCKVVKLPFYVCRQCTWVNLCGTCYALKEFPGLPWCRGHEFHKVPSDGWVKKAPLPEGAVDVEGRRELKEWLGGMLKKYEAEAVKYGVTVSE